MFHVEHPEQDDQQAGAGGDIEQELRERQGSSGV